jgi:large subunit ribosomal protein L4
VRVSPKGLIFDTLVCVFKNLFSLDGNSFCMNVKVYNQLGEETGTVELPKGVFDAKWNSDLVHQVVVGMQGNARTPVAHTKDRSEVSGGGKKPWRQKGTGKARHGSNRSPIWRGGGVTFGPRNDKIYAKKINKKMRAKALASVLSQKMRDGEVLFLDKWTFAEPKSKLVKESLTALGKIEGFAGLSKKRNAALVAVFRKERNTTQSFRNFGNMVTQEVKNINPVEVLTYKYVLIEKPEEALKVLKDRIQ